MTTDMRQTALAALFLFLAPLLLYGQSQTRELEAHLTAGHAQAASEQEPEVRAEVALLLSGAEHSPTGNIVFHHMTLNAAAPTTGEFEIINQRGKRLFAGRWVATAFHAGATQISLEGEGSSSYAETRLKLKLKARVEGPGNESAWLSGEGCGEIK